MEYSLNPTATPIAEAVHALIALVNPSLWSFLVTMSPLPRKPIPIATAFTGEKSIPGKAFTLYTETIAKSAAPIQIKV